MKPKPLDGIRVLVTRPQDDESEFSRLLDERGAIVSNLPLIGLGPPPNKREFAKAVNTASAFDWLVFTSAAGVAIFAAHLKEPLPREKPRIAVVGPVTARTARDTLGRDPEVIPDRFSGEALADALIARAASNDSVLLVQGEAARPALGARLRAAGLKVQSPPAYTTMFTQPADLEERIAQADVIALASPSAVKSLVSAFGKAATGAKTRGKVIACIGPVTLFEAREAGLHVEVVPESTTAAALVDALCIYYAKQPPFA